MPDSKEGIGTIIWAKYFQISLVIDLETKCGTILIFDTVCERLLHQTKIGKNPGESNL